MDAEKSNLDGSVACLVCGFTHKEREYCPGPPCSTCGVRGLHRCQKDVVRERCEQSAREFWERAYLACVSIAWETKCPEAPFSHRAAELATASLERWRERFDPSYGDPNG